MNSFLTHSYDSDSNIDLSMNVVDLNEVKLNKESKFAQIGQSQCPEGNALSTALNMVHLPTEVASINELGEMIDSLDNLPTLDRQDSGCTKYTRLNSTSRNSLQKLDC